MVCAFPSRINSAGAAPSSSLCREYSHNRASCGEYKSATARRCTQDPEGSSGCPSVERPCPDSIAIILRNVLTFRCGHGRNHLIYNRSRPQPPVADVRFSPPHAPIPVWRTPSRASLKVDKAHAFITDSSQASDRLSPGSPGTPGDRASGRNVGIRPPGSSSISRWTPKHKAHRLGR